MNKRMILLALSVSLAFIIGACASSQPMNPAAKGTIGNPVGTPVAAPGGANPVGTPLGVDNSQTPAAKGTIGNPVGTPVCSPWWSKPGGHTPWRGQFANTRS